MTEGHMPRSSHAGSVLPAGDSFVLLPGVVLTPEGPRADTAVGVRDGAVVYVGPAGGIAAEHAGLVRVSLPDAVVMPGLVDAHNHMSQAFAKSLANGEPAQLWKRMWMPLSASMSEEDFYRSAKWTAAELLRGGVTTVAVAGEPFDGRGLAGLRGVLDAGIRVVYGFGFADLADYSSRVKPQGSPPSTDAALRAASGALDADLGHPRLSVSLAAGTVHTATPALLRGLSALACERGVLFQFHANEHTPEVEYCLDVHGRRPIELLADLGVLGRHVLLAHCSLVTPGERNLLAVSGTAVSYNPVASAWKGNAVAPALDFAASGIRFGLGTDATRSDGFRLMDAAETAQRLVHSMAVDDFVAGAGSVWVAAATRGGADAVGLGGRVGSIAVGFRADLLVLRSRVLETACSWDLEWDLVRFYDRTNLQGVYVDGRLVVDDGEPTAFAVGDFVGAELGAGRESVARAPLHKVHGVGAFSFRL